MIDLLVAGGGPVGLAAAVLAAQAGWRVRVVDPREDPIDKACGEGLMPAALHALAGLGVDPPGQPLAGIRYLGAGRVAEARFRAGPGRGVRRTALHDALATRADALGIERHRGRVHRVHQDGTGVEAAGVRARWLIAADGLHSPVRRHLGLGGSVAVATRRVPPPARYGLRRHFAVPPWSDLVEVHWGRAAEAYVTPVAPDVVGVALLMSRQAAGPLESGYDGQLARFPDLAARLHGRPPVTRVLGAGPLRQQPAARRSGRVLLAGDAAGYVDALTGEGVAVGLASARAAVHCLLADRPEDYEAAWRRLSRRYRLLTGGLLWAGRQPALRDRIVPAASHVPCGFRAGVHLLAL